LSTCIHILYERFNRAGTYLWRTNNFDRLSLFSTLIHTLKVVVQVLFFNNIVRCYFVFVFIHTIRNTSDGSDANAQYSTVTNIIRIYCDKKVWTIVFSRFTWQFIFSSIFEFYSLEVFLRKSLKFLNFRCRLKF